MGNWFNLELSLLSTNSIQAILFDLDGTLRHNRPNANDALFDYATLLGVEDQPEKRLQAARWSHYYWAQSPEMINDKQSFPDEDLFWINYCQHTLIAYGCMPVYARELAPELFRFMRDEYEPVDWVPPDVPGTLENLQSAGLRLAMLSNRSKPYEEELEALGLAGYFEFAMAAGEVDVWKPDPLVFRYALDQLGTQPGKTLYIGDNYYADVVGARRAGLFPILVDPDGVFPEAECTVIQNVGDLCEMLNK